MSKIEEIHEGWLRHRLVLQELLETIDNNHINFKPWEGAYSMGSLAVHIATSTDMFVKSVKNGVFTPPAANQFETMEDVRDIVQRLTEVTKEELGSLSHSQLLEKIEINRFYVPGSLWISNAADHEIHHKGQLFTYARMVGVEKVPFFIKQPSKKQ
ncbi:DinB family protein [Virgibacillus oceani]|uniref:Damage-inducible protein DinB n=1 Tax=Virgibacillus oceani TaxID=1479511 RepID=A0A917HHR9_9BACI|nr:DinB family protein [Virgibacillus oceani]GGG78496.1 hypothetical protein GCM10011398_24690 [Virgibacillus oceani]